MKFYLCFSLISSLLFTSQPAQTQADSRLIKEFGNGYAYSVAWSPDGTTIAIGGNLGVWLYPSDLSHLIAHFDGNVQPIHAIAWNPHEKQIATVGGGGEFLLWDTVSGKPKTLSQMDHTTYGGPHVISYSPDGKQIAVVINGAVSLWDTTTGKRIKTFKSAATINAVDWNADGKRLAIGGEIPSTTGNVNDGQIVLQVWAVDSGKVLATFKPSTEEVNLFTEAVSDVQWTDHGKSVAALFTGSTGVVHIWGVDPDSQPGTDELQIGGSGIAAMSYTTDEDVHAIVRVAIGVEADFTGGAFEDTPPTSFSAIAWSPDERQFCFITSNGIFIVDTHQQGNGVGAYFAPVAQNKDFAGQPGYLEWQENQLAVVEMVIDNFSIGYIHIKEFDVTDLLTGKSLKTIQPADGQGMSIASFSPDNKYVIVDDQASDNLWLMDVAMGQKTQAYSLPNDLDAGQGGGGGGGPVFDEVYWSPDGTHFAADYRGGIVIWDVQTADSISIKNVGRDNGWSPDSRFIAGDDAIYDATTGKAVVTFPKDTFDPHHAVISAWEPHGTYFAAIANDGKIHIWATADGKLVTTLAGITIEWSPDGTLLAVATKTGTVELYDGKGANGQILKTGQATLTAFRPDSKQIAIGLEDGTIAVWNMLMRKLQYTLTGHKGPLDYLLWQPDGAQLVSQGSDNTTRLWRTVP